jgi:flagellar basal-body rod protein FlgG
MALVTRTVGPLIALLLAASMTVGSFASDAPAKNESAPASTTKSAGKEAPAPRLRRPDGANANHSANPVIAEASKPERVIRNALQATDQARQIIVGNLANANTPGYKRQIVSFATLVEGPGLPAEELPNIAARDAAQRLGVMLSTPHTDMRPGKIRRTGRPLDLAIDGVGFFWVEPADAPTNREVYCTRCGRFVVDDNRHLVLRGLQRDWILTPRLQTPRGVTKIDISADGLVFVTEPGRAADPKDGDNRTNIGTFDLNSFPPDCTFTPCGDGVFLVRWGDKRHGVDVSTPGNGGFGVLRQGCLEESNVDPQQELEDLQKIERHAQILEQAARLLHPQNSSNAGSTDRSAK